MMMKGKGFSMRVARVTDRIRDLGLPGLMVLGLTLAGARALPAQEDQADPAPRGDDAAAILAVVDALFDGMREKDEAMLRSVFHPDARLHSTGMDASGSPVTRAAPIDGFIQNVVSGAAHLDEVTFDEEVRVDGNLGMAWTPYNLFVDGQFQHCGVDVFVMIRTAQGWKILQIGDTRRREGCDPSRRD